jgi:hypothetical protein
MKKKIHWHPDWKLHKIESLQLQLDFEEVIDDDKALITRLKSDIRDLKLKILLDENIKEEDEKEYFD